MKTLIYLFAIAMFIGTAYSSDNNLFMENKGQYKSVSGKSANEVLYYYNSGDFSVYLRADGLSYVYHQISSKELVNEEQEFYRYTRDSYRVDMNFAEANRNVKFDLYEAESFTSWYLSGTQVISKEFRSITYNDLYKGIDLKVYFNEDNSLEYDFIISPEADPDQIQLEFLAADNLRINQDGSISSKNTITEFSQSRPISYQLNKTNVINSEFYFISENVLGIKIDDYDRSQPLIIDPMTRLWGTLYGGNDYDDALDVAVDGSGNIYFAGVSASENNSNYIASIGAYQTTYMGGLSPGTGDAMLVKMSSTGTRLWSTYFGGTNDEVGYAVDVDGLGNVYLTGFTKSFTNISTIGAYQPVFGGNTDAFLVKFSSMGVRLWSTYYGGTANDKAHHMDVMQDGTIFICGRTTSSNAISSTGSHQEYPGGGAGSDGFLVKFSTDGGRLWGTYYGGDQSDFSYGCAADVAGNVALVGVTFSDDNISTIGSHQVNYAGGGGADGYLALFNTIGERVWATYYGGETNGGDMAYGVEFDSNSNLYICGTTSTETTNVIATAGSHQPDFGGGTVPYEYDAFIAKFNPYGERQWGTYYGGEGNDYGDKIAIDGINNIYLFGSTQSESDIATTGAFKTDNPFGGYFVASFDNNSDRNWATYYGCCSADRRYRGGIDISNNGVVYIANHAIDDEDFITDNAHQTELRGDEDAFFASLGDLTLSLSLDKDTYCPEELAEFTVTVSSTTNSGFSTGNEFLIEISNTNGQFVTFELVGAVTSTTSITFSLPIPPNVVEGESYRFRVHSTNPKLISSDNGIDITINSKPDEEIQGEFFICKNDYRVYTVATLPQYEYAWSVEGGEIMGADDFNSVLIEWGEDDFGRVDVEITNSNTLCSATMSKDIALVEKPQIEINGSVDVCIGSTISYVANENEDVVYSWIVDGGKLITVADGDRIAVEWDEIGEATIELTESYPDYDCDTTYSITVNIKDIPNTGIDAALEVCVDGEGVYSAHMQGDKYSYIWEVENGAIKSDDGSELIVIWHEIGNGSVKLTITDTETDCSADSTYNVIIHPKPDAELSGIIDVCKGCAEAYLVTGDYTKVITWLASGGTIMSESDSEIEVQWGDGNEGEIMAVVANEFGCIDTLGLKINITDTPGASILGDTSVCLNDIIVYSTSSNPNYENVWEVTNGNVLSEPANHQIEVQWTELGTGKVKLTQTDTETQIEATNDIDVQVYQIPPTPVIDLEVNTLHSSWTGQNQWYYEGSKIPGATNESYTPTNEGNYSVKAINEWGCESELSEEFFYEVISVVNIPDSRIEVYPNPADDMITVRLKSDDPILEISLIDMFGNSMSYEKSSDQTQQLSVESLSSGVYYLQISTITETITQKIIIQR